jgi:hypothetical protein
MPTSLGYWASFAPAWIHKLALVFMFVAEIPAPFLIFVGGSWRLLGAAILLALQVGCR